MSAKKVLIVDDSGLARRMTRQLLQDLGHEVEEAADGAQALERYVINKHDVVLLDMVMHGMYGLEVLEKLKQLNPVLPVIIVTADIQKSTREQVHAAGAAAIVNKPLNREELAAVLNNILEGGASWS
jgi:two-component system, chemotaxis family, chemotaxis protein CheY